MRSKRSTWLAILTAFGLGLAVGLLAGKRANQEAVRGLPEAVEVERPGGGHRGVKLVPVAIDTGDEWVVLQPAGTGETWRFVLRYPGGRSVAFFAQQVAR